jgi:ferredoxin-NADP reductase
VGPVQIFSAKRNPKIGPAPDIAKAVRGKSINLLAGSMADFELMESGKLYADLGVPDLDAEHDRVMICGSPGMLRDLKHMLETRGFKEGNTSTPGAFVIERAFAEQ